MEHRKDGRVTERVEMLAGRPTSFSLLAPTQMLGNVALDRPGHFRDVDLPSPLADSL